MSRRFGPTTGNDPCGCPRNAAGDIRCHNCGEYVNVICWNCKTPRGAGECHNDWTTPAPKAPTDGRLVRIRFRYTNGKKRTPWKWHAVCVCGHNELGWDWARCIGYVNDHLREKHAA